MINHPSDDEWCLVTLLYVYWKTKKQHTISQSLVKVEYRTMATTTCELQSLKRFLSNLRLFMINQWSFILIVRWLYIFPKTRCSLNSSSTLNWTSILIGIKFSKKISTQSLLLLLLLLLLKALENRCLTLFMESWY